MTELEESIVKARVRLEHLFSLQGKERDKVKVIDELIRLRVQQASK